MNTPLNTILIVWICLLMVQYVQAQDTLRLAFGSCNKAHLDQSYWTEISREKADAWIWLGDIVYADTEKSGVLKKKFKELKTNQYYKDFIKTHEIYGIWDDHDYGTNDGGKHYKIKKNSRDILFDFLDLPKNNPAWEREAAYQSHIIKGENITVRLLLLDVRYFRDELLRDTGGNHRYSSDDTAQILGETQWKWLEQELESTTEDVIIIGSGFQMIPEEHPYEKWADYPKERKRLLDILALYHHKNIVLISGDRHMAEVSAIAVDAEHLVYEITSSGLTHTWTLGDFEPNIFRIREFFPVKNYATLDIYKQGDILSVNSKIKSIEGKLLDSYEILPQ